MMDEVFRVKTEIMETGSFEDEDENRWVFSHEEGELAVMKNVFNELKLLNVPLSIFETLMQPYTINGTQIYASYYVTEDTLLREGDEEDIL